MTGLPRVLGFTGTQLGLTDAQQEQLVETLERVRPSVVAHGDCVGADAEFHQLVRDTLPDCVIEVWPPENSAKRAWCVGDDVHEPLPYMTRNLAIAKTTFGLIACPGETKEQLRSGTWSTVRRARRYGRPILILYPDGTFEVEKAGARGAPPRLLPLDGLL